jgi:hypothetical protein
VGTTFDGELHRAMREQKIVEFEAYSVPTGRWLEVRVHPTEDGLVGFSHDVSERKAAQEEIHRGAEEQALVAELGQRALASEDLQSLFHRPSRRSPGRLSSSWPPWRRCRPAARR